MENHDRHNLLALLCISFFAFVAYLLCAMIGTSFNIGDWHWALRSVFAVALLWLLVKFIDLLKTSL